MMSIMSILITYSARKVSSKSVVPPLVWYIDIDAPLGVLVPLVLVAPSRFVWVDSRLGLGCCCSCFFLSFWNCSTDGSDFLYSAVRNFDIAERERVEQNSPHHEDVGEPWVVGDQEMESPNPGG
jgi:hypothetical protein